MLGNSTSRYTSKNAEQVQACGSGCVAAPGAGEGLAKGARDPRDRASEAASGARDRASEKRQAERAAAAAERRATRHAVVRALEASLRQDKDYRFGVQPCPWYALYGDCKSEKCGRDHRPCLVREALLARARKAGGEKQEGREEWERMSQGSSTDTVVCGKW